MKKLTSKIKGVGIFLGLSFCVGAGTQAGTYTETQTQTFSTNGIFSGTGQSTFLNDDYFAADFLPFSGPTNTLVSFTVTWLVTFSVSATSSNGVVGGFNTDPEPDGALSIDMTNYYGAGGGYSSVATNNGGVIPSKSITDGNTNAFLVSEAGADYNPALLADVLNGDSVDLLWSTGFGLEYNKVASGTYSVSGETYLTYTATPEPSTLALLGIGMAGGFLVYCRRHWQVGKV